MCVCSGTRVSVMSGGILEYTIMDCAKATRKFGMCNTYVCLVRLFTPLLAQGKARTMRRNMKRARGCDFYTTNILKFGLLVVVEGRRGAGGFAFRHLGGGG